jgi:hypothetical protein
MVAQPCGVVASTTLATQGLMRALYGGQHHDRRQFGQGLLVGGGHHQPVAFRTGSVVASWVSWCRSTVCVSEGQGFRSVGYGLSERDDAASACDSGVGTGHEQRGEAFEPGQQVRGGVYNRRRTGEVNGWSSHLWRQVVRVCVVVKRRGSPTTPCSRRLRRRETGESDNSVRRSRD